MASVTGSNAFTATLNASSRIMVGREVFSKLKEELRQGCPFSPYLFIFSVEILAKAFRRNRNIKGIVVNHGEVKLSQYADDTDFDTWRLTLCCLLSYSMTSVKSLASERHFLEQNLWFNSLIRINNAPFFYKERERSGIRNIKHLKDTNNNFLSLQELEKKWRL